MISTMMATRPNPLQPKLTSISGTQTCNGPDWPGGQNNQVEPFVFSFEIIWRIFKKTRQKTPVVAKQRKTCLKRILFKCKFSSTLCVGLSNIEFRNIYCRPNFQSIFCNLKQNEMAQKHIFCQHILLHLKVLNQLAFVLNKVMLPRRAGVPSKNISTIESSSPSF